jgi:hypothetical protein
VPHSLQPLWTRTADPPLCHGIDADDGLHDARTLAVAIDQGFGKPVERVERHDEGALDLDNLTNEQLLAFKRAVLDDEITSARLRDGGVTEAA